MTTSELVTLYFVIGSIMPVYILCTDRDSLGLARLASGLESDKRFNAAMIFAFIAWPLMLLTWVLIKVGAIDPKDYS